MIGLGVGALVDAEEHCDCENGSIEVFVDVLGSGEQGENADCEEGVDIWLSLISASLIAPGNVRSMLKEFLPEVFLLFLPREEFWPCG